MRDFDLDASAPALLVIAAIFVALFLAGLAAFLWLNAAGAA